MPALPVRLCRCEPGAAAPLSVAVLLSGGVDSSLALRLLRAAGHEATAFYLQIWFQEDFRNFWDACPWEEDLEYCRQVRAGQLPALLAGPVRRAGPPLPLWRQRLLAHHPCNPAALNPTPHAHAHMSRTAAAQVCEQLGVPLEVVPLTEEYWDRVVAHSIAEMRQGRTPNPDVLCNSRLVLSAEALGWDGSVACTTLRRWQLRAALGWCGAQRSSCNSQPDMLHPACHPHPLAQGQVWCFLRVPGA